MSEIYLEHRTITTSEVTIYISKEGARYIADVMAGVSENTGARSISRQILEALG